MLLSLQLIGMGRRAASFFRHKAVADVSAVFGKTNVEELMNGIETDLGPKRPWEPCEFAAS